MKNLFLTGSLILSVLTTAAESLWLRYPAISPDGSRIAFTYKGDIYTVASAGGRAVRLTSDPAYDYAPVWSPDGKRIAFSNDRHGNFDLYLVDAEGGAPRRLTTHSAAETPYAFTPDGRQVVFGATIADPATSALFPKASMGELYAVPVDGGRPVQLLATPAEYVDFNGQGDGFLYQDKKGGENIWRKHHTSSITRDIWYYDAKTGKHTKLTDFEGEDRMPVFTDGGATVCYLSERGGTFNVWSFPFGESSAARQLTKFKTHPVRFLTAAADGTLCFGFNGDIYTLRSGAPRKVAIELPDCSEPLQTETLTVSGGHSAVVSPDGKQIALIHRGDVFVTSTDYPTTKQITSTPQSERDPVWSPDGRTLAYMSERDGKWNIYTARPVREEEINFSNATLIDERPLFEKADVDRRLPQYSPDGKEIAFIEDRCRLMVKNLETGKVRQITDGSQNYTTTGSVDFQWSPDGKWFAIAFTGNRHDPYSDIGLVSAEGGKPVVNLTNNGYFNNNPRWVMGGNAILFGSDRYGMRNHASWGSLSDVMIVFLNPESFDRARLNKEEYELLEESEKRAAKEAPATGKKDSETAGAAVEPIQIDLRNVEDRIVRLTPASSSLSDAIIDKKNEKLFYVCAFDGRYDLRQLDLRSGDTKVIQKNCGSASLQWDGGMKDLFVLGSRLYKLKGAAGTPAPIEVRGEMRIDRAAERRYMFDRVYREEKERFYTKDMHGVDWESMYANYGRFLPSINNNYDFAELLSEMLGELNVSHTGSTYSRPASANSVATAELGVILDPSYTGDGLRIDEVVETGPFDKASIDARKGDLIEKIDGHAITAGSDYYPLLDRKAGKKVLVTLYRPSDKSRREAVVKPVSRGAYETLLYKRWVKQREADVERLSGGRLGYVHIKSMGDPSFRTVYGTILGKYNHCDGIVIDTRFNGGGRLHEDIEVLFSGKKYLTQVVRGKEACDMPSRRWNKPSIMITGEANYSNAHGTPWVYQHRKIGRIVGMPVPGTMTSVSWERLQDQTLVFGIPIIGYRQADGTYLENTQVEPDIKVANSPERVVKGEDEQLAAAVKALLEEIDAAETRP